MMRRVVLAVVLAAVLCPALAAAQEVVFLVRHAEKEIDSDEPGVGLSDAGHARAERLASLLREAGITAIYTSATRRTRQTAEPLAKMLGLKPKTYSVSRMMDGYDFGELIKDLRQEKVVLVVGHANTVPETIRQLGYSVPMEIPPAEFDNLFILIPQKDGPPRLIHLHY